MTWIFLGILRTLGKFKCYQQYQDLVVKNTRVETYKDGKLYGEYIDYFVNGEKRSEGKMYYNQMEGEWIFWYHNGKKELECEFDFGTMIGVAKIYHDSGILKEEVKLWLVLLYPFLQ